MSKDGRLQVPEIDDASRDQSYRHSLQPKGANEGPALRHTQSHNYGAKKKKVKVPPPPIPESTKVEIVNEQVKKARSGKGSRRNSQASSRLGVDNVAFEVEDGLRISRGNSAASSVRSSTRDPSVQSLTVVREQYCCFARRTPCERALFAAICVLSFIVLVLIVVVILIAVQSNDSDDDNGTKSTNPLLSVLDFTKM